MQKDGVSLGMESQAQAREILSKVVENSTQLRSLIESTAPHPEHRRGDIWPCSECGKGRLHCWGRNKLPDGRMGLGSLFICDACSHHETRRK